MSETLKTLETLKLERRIGFDRRKKQDPTAFTVERRKTPRRRQIDPTTCERDYTTEEIEFMQAMDAYKRSSGRMFPTCSEVLEVIRALGYAKLSPVPAAAPLPVAEALPSVPA